MSAAPQAGNGPRTIIATYDYRDSEGRLLYQVVRYQPKGFAVRRPDGVGGWAWGAGDAPKVLYRLPELLAADPWVPVFFPEGEKDVDRLIEHGLVATTNPHGAGAWDDAWAAPLAGRPVVIIPDNDDPGRRHAATVADSLLPLARSVKILASRNRPAGGDISDWFDEGGNARSLLRLAERCPLVVRRDEQPSGPLAHTEWAQEITPRAVGWLWEDWLPKGKLVILGGHPGVGKSTLAAAFAALLSRAAAWPDGRTAPAARSLFLLGEDSADDTLLPRLASLAADLSKVAVLHGVAERPGSDDLPLDLADPEHLILLEREVRQREIGLVIIDPLSAFLGERNRNDEGEIRSLLTPLGRLARELDVTILGVMHVGKPGAGKRTPLQSLLGATAFGAYARTVLMAAEAPNQERGVLGVVKSNLARRPRPIEWGRDAAGGIVWHGESARSIEAILAGERERQSASAVGATDEAIAFLRAALAHGPRPAKDIDLEAKELGISRGTLKRARLMTGIDARRVGRTWYAALPNTDWDDLLDELTHAALAVVRGGAGAAAGDAGDRHGSHE